MGVIVTVTTMHGVYRAHCHLTLVVRWGMNSRACVPCVVRAWYLSIPVHPPPVFLWLVLTLGFVYLANIFHFFRSVVYCVSHVTKMKNYKPTMKGCLFKLHYESKNITEFTMSRSNPVRCPRLCDLLRKIFTFQFSAGWDTPRPAYCTWAAVAGMLMSCRRLEGWREGGRARSEERKRV